MGTQFEKLKAALADRYDLIRIVGEGGMATVYLARDLKHRREVAVKVLRPELAATLGAERFIMEIEIAAGLTHAHIVPVFDSGQAGDFLYYVQPFIDGESLADRLGREQQLPLDDVTRIMSDIAGALAKAHARGVVHRDIKPDNVMLSDNHAFVTDFGVAKALTDATGHNLTTAGVALGTPAYMAPEQAAADPDTDHRADLYALGAVGYEMLTGNPPFSGTNLQQIIAAQVRDVAAPVAQKRPDVSPAIASTVMRCLEKRPEDRWQSADELVSILDGQRGTPVPRQTKQKNTTRKLRHVMVGAVSVVALATVGLTLLGRGSGATSELSQDVIAVAPFDLLGIQADVWAEGFAELLSHNLDGAGRLRTVSPTVSFARWTGRADPASAARYGREFHAGLALFGRIIAVGSDSVRVSATLLDVADESIVRTVEDRGGLNELPNIADRVAVDLLSVLSRLRSLGAAQLNSLGSESPGAIREFLLGERHYRSFRMDSAALHYHRALRADSAFALALGRLGMIAAWDGSSGTQANAYRLAAGALNHGLSTRESLLVVADSLASSFPLQTLHEQGTAQRMNRYFETLQTAMELYPGDAQIVYRMGEGFMHRGWARSATETATLEMFDEAVRLDSAFALAYPHLFYLRYSFEGLDAGNEAVRAYLTLRPSGATAVGAQTTLELVQQLTNGNRSFLDTASAFQLLGPVGMVGRAVDTLEAGVEAARQLVRKDPSFRSVASLTIAYRGHLEEAKQALATPNGIEEWMLVAEANYLLGSSGLMTDLVNAPRPQDVHPFLTFRHWADHGDTTSFSGFLDELGSDGGPQSQSSNIHQFVTDRAQAFWALARHDSTMALEMFDRLSSETCPIGCYWTQLTHAQLLGWAGRHEDAVRLLTPFPQLIFGPSLPGEIIWVLERARARERVNDVGGARLDYARVVNAWAQGDDAVQPAVNAAREGLTRLVAEVGS